MMRKYLTIFSIFVVLIYLFRKPLTAAYLARTSGAQAVADASQTGYTTYNQTLYVPGFWRPVIQFFKADAYVPKSTSKQAGSDLSAYSVQG
jgi:hypothetical protein